MPRTWTHRPLMEEAKMTAAPLAGLAAYGLVLSQIFDPVAAGMAAIAGATGLTMRLADIFAQDADDVRRDMLRDRLVYNMDTPNFSIFDDRKPSRMNDPVEGARHKQILEALLKDISAEMGIPNNYQVYYAYDAMLDVSQSKSIPIQTRRENMFFVHMTSRTITVTPESMRKYEAEGKLKFIVAHELSHVKTKDHLSARGLLTPTIRQASRFALWSTVSYLAIATAMEYFGFSAHKDFMPYKEQVGPWIALAAETAAATLAGVFNAISYRKAEARADRNALATTKDIDGARAVLADLKQLEAKGIRALNPWYAVMRHHPVPAARSKALEQGWTRIQRRLNFKPA